MKKAVAIVFALVMAFTITATALADTFPDEPAVCPTGWQTFGPGCINGDDGPYNWNFNRCPTCAFGDPGSYYATGAIEVWQYVQAKRVPAFDNPVEICFWDPGVGTVKFFGGSGWQTMPTYLFAGFRCTQTTVPGTYVITAADWEH